MNNEEIEKYAEMLISMSTEYLLGKYDEQLYVDILKTSVEKMVKIKSKDIDNNLNYE